MRDGIFKSLPMSPAWRHLGTLCSRSADRGANASAAAVTALLRDSRKELSRPFLTALRRFLSAEQLPLFTEAPSPFVFQDVAQETPLERHVHEHMARLWEAGERGKDLVTQALQEALIDWAQQNVREIDAHIGGERRSDARATLEAIASACGAALPDVVQELVHGPSPLPRRPSRPAIDPDEDLQVPA